MIWHLNTGDGFGSGEELYLMARGTSTLTLHHYPGPDVNIESTAAAPGVWHHFAVVRSGTTMSLYLNGILVGSDTSFTLATAQVPPLIFGGHTDVSATFAPRWFDGKLDELAVFNTALAPAEITTLFNGMTTRHFGGLSTTATISLSAAPVSYVWTSTPSGNWSTGTNWQAGASPTSSRGASVQFFTGQTLAAGTTTATNDIAGVLQMNNLTLAGTSTAAMTSTITGGTFQLLNNGTTLPTVNLTGTSGSGTNILTYNINTPVVLGADTTFNGSNSGTFIFNGDVSGSGGIIRNSTSSKLVLAGTNSYTGDTTINAGTLQIGNDGATGSLGTGDVINNGTLRFDRTGTLTVPNAITGTGGVQIDCPINLGTVVFSGTNTFDGGVNVVGGTLRITNSTALGDGTKTVTLSNGTAGAPHLNLDGSSDPIELPATISYTTSSATGAIINEAGDNTIFGPINLTGGGGDTKILVNGGTLTLAGSIAPIATGRNLLLDGAGTGIVTSPISNGSGANVLLGVNKQSAGTWTLSGANSHSGTTTVTAGTLVIAHPNALGSGGLQFGSTVGATSITSGAVLDLNGQQSVNEVITVRGTGISSVGALINNSATAASISNGVHSISTTPGGVHSTVPDVILSGNATAVATLGLSAASFTINGGTTQYSAAPTVTITGGGGTGATATATLTSGVVSGITITNAGVGYTSAPTVAFSGGTVTNALINPTGTGNATNFIVSGIQVTNPGSGYTSAPSVTFSSGTGTTATANMSAAILAANSSIGGSGDIGIHPGISGAFTLTKVGAGTLTLHGANTHGTTTINAGRLALSGSLTSNLTTNAAIFAPQGIPSTTANLTQASTATFQIRLNSSTVGSGYDQLTVNGTTVSLNGALDLICGPHLAPGSTFTILNKTSPGLITGTFAGKANNSTFTDDGYTFQITYAGGTGNDVVLTLITTPIEQWRFTNYGSVLNTGTALDTADTDGDGVANLLEYATKMNPAANDVAPQSATKNGTNLEYIYTKNKAATDVTFAVEWSDDFTTWSTAGVTQALVPGSDNGVTQQWKATLPAGVNGKRFVRLRVTR
jgi:autotransporter-associated beta strand protein